MAACMLYLFMAVAHVYSVLLGLISTEINCKRCIHSVQSMVLPERRSWCWRESPPAITQSFCRSPQSSFCKVKKQNSLYEIVNEKTQNNKSSYKIKTAVSRSFGHCNVCPQVTYCP